MKYLPIWYRASCHLTMNKTLIRSVQLVTGGLEEDKANKGKWLVREVRCVSSPCLSFNEVGSRVKQSPPISLSCQLVARLHSRNCCLYWGQGPGDCQYRDIVTRGQVRDLGTVSTGISSPGTLDWRPWWWWWTFYLLAVSRTYLRCLVRMTESVHVWVDPDGHCLKLTTKLSINISVPGLIPSMHTTIQSQWRALRVVNSS